ncbi:ankyrin repeat domain-containing protein [Pelomonas sp. SE-A7]|uniref:ankyrin repeat domain-containing protein n=1 Tax=Pelomonas sp. SE-A7 TaxID=3054953 RepID=UPI00259CB9EB|nr:ankyrin repeat domain-containing protein [Pelomonas sp. SE-A7]MDM4768554.1 ankyrin repeat domain-containing protein [Pelomonas sp. SE-A7]
MSHRSFTKLYALAEAGESAALLSHISELLAEFPEDRDPLNWALIAAAEANQIETVHALLSAGASVEGASQRPYIRPLWKAAKRGHLQMVCLLVERGANPRATDNDGMTALDYARRYSRIEVVQYLESLA